MDLCGGTPFNHFYLHVRIFYFCTCNNIKANATHAGVSPLCFEAFSQLHFLVYNPDYNPILEVLKIADYNLNIGCLLTYRNNQCSMNGIQCIYVSCTWTQSTPIKENTQILHHNTRRQCSKMRTKSTQSR